MTRRLSPRHRRTRLGFDVGRATGFYEQCDDRVPSQAKAADRFAALPGSLVASGLVGRPGVLVHPLLRSIAGSDRMSDFDARVVAVADLLGRVRLDVAADLILWHGPDGSRTATSIARLLDGAGSYLVLGGEENARPQWSSMIVLRSPDVPNDGEIDVVGLTATTFAEFVGANYSGGAQ